MLKKICFNIDKLMEKLPNFEILRIKSIDEDEDGIETKDKYYISSRNDINRIVSSYGFWVSREVYFSDGTSISMYGSNVNSEDKSLIRVEGNNIISRSLRIEGTYVEYDEALKKWLDYNGLTEDKLEDLKEEFDIYNVIEYPGVNNPVSYGDHFAYSNEYIKLDERDIKTVLDSIDDPLLREKIRCILYARIFKRLY